MVIANILPVVDNFEQPHFIEIDFHYDWIDEVQ